MTRPAQLAAGLLLACAWSLACAQINQAITDAQLLDPWTQAQAAVAAIPAAAAADPDQAARDAQALDESLSTLRARFEDTAIRIVARPEFSYDAAQTSADMAKEVGDAATRFGAWLNHYPQTDATAARDGIARLQDILAQRHAFERDVLQTLGSGSKNAIQALARRWWTASEQVEALRLAVAARRP